MNDREERLLLSRLEEAVGRERKRLIPGSTSRIVDHTDYLVEVRDKTPAGVGGAFQIFSTWQVIDARSSVIAAMEALGAQVQNCRTTQTHIRAIVEDLNSEGHRAHYLTHEEKLLVNVNDLLQISFDIALLYWTKKVSSQIWSEVDKVASLRAPKTDWRPNEMIPEDFYQ